MKLLLTLVLLALLVNSQSVAQEANGTSVTPSQAEFQRTCGHSRVCCRRASMRPVDATIDVIFGLKRGKRDAM